MESSSTLVPRVSPAARHCLPLSGPDDLDVHSELALARITRRNVLLVGPDDVVEKLVNLLVTEPVPGPLSRHMNVRRASQPSPGFETLVLRNVDTLTIQEQRRMLDWLESKKSKTQVVSTASAPLLPRVESGAFNDALYYRLNMVYVDLTV